MNKSQGRKLAAGAGAMMIAEPALALAHQGGTGVIVGFAAGAIAYLVAGEIAAATGKDDPLPVARDADPSKPSALRRMAVGKSVRGGEDEIAPPQMLPDGPFYFSEVLKGFTPSLSKIYLATLPDGKPVFIKARELCHTALAGATRGGKDHLIRQLMSQLCYAGAKCYLLNPNYTRYDLETEDPYGRPYPEDWTPFEAWLRNDPREMIPRDRKWKVIEHYLKEAFDLVERRLEAYGYSEKPLGAPQFLFVNEVPAIVDEVPRTAHYLKKILREGAKVGVFMVNASQDFQVSTVFKEVGGGIRKCYRTAFDVGSDPATQNALGLPVAKGLGKGKISLRCDDVLGAGRAPYVDNESLYRLLGPSTYGTSASQDEAEDELVSYMVSGAPAERDTDPAIPQQQRRHVSMSAYELRRQKLAARKPAAYVAATKEREMAPAQSDERRIPTLDEVRAAFPSGKPSKRDIQKQFGLTDYQAYKLYGQL